MSNLKNCYIGPRIMNKLNNIGIITIEDLARTRVHHLINAGVGKYTANKIVRTAREICMDIHGFYKKYGFKHHIAKKYILQGVDFHDSLILEKIQENIKKHKGDLKWLRELHDFSYEVDIYEEDHDHSRFYDKIIKEDYLDRLYGIFYKIDENGKVILLWFGNGCPISELGRIPDDLVELSHLKYLCLICDVQGFESLPTTIKSNNIFDVKTNPIYEGDESNVTGYEITIIRKGTLDGYDSAMYFLIEEAFKRYS
ncbi:MAG: hypothetical protein V3V33_09650 [Candidatus Lokiarchaeia archaeon]